MEKALTKVGSFWISKKAKEEISNMTQYLSGLEDVLREHNLPGGVFPTNNRCYELDESKGKLVVHMPYRCEVCFKDSSLVRYGRRVKCTLSKGKLTVLDGMKTKVLVWVKVTSVAVERHRSQKVWFATSGVNTCRPRDAYDMPRQAIRVEDF